MLSKFFLPNGSRRLQQQTSLVQSAARSFAVEMSMGGQRVEVSKDEDGSMKARPLYLDN